MELSIIISVLCWMLMQHPGLDSCIVTEKIVKLSCTVKSLYFTMAEPKRRYLVPGYILPPFEKTSSRCSKTLTYHPIIKLTITQMHTHYTQLYIAGNFHIWPMLLGSVEESGDQHAHLTILTFSHSCCFCQFGQSKQSLTKCNVFPISKCPAFPRTLLKVNPVLCNWLL